MHVSILSWNSIERSFGPMHPVTHPSVVYANASRLVPYCTLGSALRTGKYARILLVRIRDYEGLNHWKTAVGVAFNDSMIR